jgi:enamine deaminase RidA (YjgF/YER057c/UK114 family)
MERTAVNPWSWSVKLGFDQAQLVEGHRRELICSGQDAVDANGNAQHPGDMAAQLGLALDNLEAVLAGADMTLTNVVRLNVYTTDMDTLLQHFAMVNERFEGTGVRFATTLLGVARLAAPDLVVALEAIDGLSRDVAPRPRGCVILVAAATPHMRPAAADVVGARA